MSVRFLDLRAIHESIRDELDEAIRRAVHSGWYVLGPEVEAFEAEWAAYVGAAHCVSVGNGLDAITLTLRALGVGAGDEVVAPVPAEVDDRTYNLVSYDVTPRTRAVLPVHLFGQPTAVPDLGVPVVDDAAQAHGARWGGVRVGGQGRTACWSFYPGKNLGALGDGGAVTTDDARLADTLRLLRNYGSRRKYVHEQAGVNSRLDEVQAAALRVKLRHLDAWNAHRARLAAHYTEALADVVVTPYVPPEADPVWHLYVIRVPNRDGVAERLAQNGIETLVHYPTPPHRQAAFAATRHDLPVADRLAAEVLSLPMGPHVDDAAADEVIEAVRAAVR